MSLYVVVGYSRALMQDLELVLPAGSVTILEDPHVIVARNVREEMHDLKVVNQIVAAPTQHEHTDRTLAEFIDRPEQLRAVFPATEYGVVGAAALAEAWGMPGATTAAAQILRDKVRLRQVAGRAGIAQPEWEKVSSHLQVAAFRAEHGGRCVLKPANRQASLGVQVLEHDDDIESAWAHTVAADEPRIRARDLDDDRYIAESVLSGSEVSVEALVRDGSVTFFNVTDKDVHPGRYPVEAGHLVPSAQPQQVWDDLRAATGVLVDALGFANGVLHGEWILINGEPHLVECAGRLPGDYIYALIGHAYDTDLVLDYLATVSVDDPENLPSSAHRAAAVRFLFAEPGVVTEVTNVNDDSAFTELNIAAAVGDVVSHAANSWQRLGSAMLFGGEPAHTRRLLWDRVRGITIRTERQPG